MATSTVESDFHVLIVGAGAVGLLIAQRLKTLGIECTVFEQENYLNERSHDWSFGIYWAQELLRECLPQSLLDNINTAQVDPLRTLGPDDYIPIFDGSTGGKLWHLPTPYVYRLKKSSFRALLAEGMNVQFGKTFKSIALEPASDGAAVTAIFEDGTKATGDLIVGADGAKSKVREYLLGSQMASLQSLPIIGCQSALKFPPEIARKVAAELDGQITLNILHPVGMSVFFSSMSACYLFHDHSLKRSDAAHEIPDRQRPETWEWRPTITFRQEGTHLPTTAKEVRIAWMKCGEKLVEPFRSAILSLPERAFVWSGRPSQWPTRTWDNLRGSVTLAGDAAHAMTYHGGQGLNNAVRDAVYLCRALVEHLHKGIPLLDALATYEAELVERGREAVRSSCQNSLMLHDWERMRDSPYFKHGVATAPKG